MDIDVKNIETTATNLLEFVGEKKYCTIYADPPWRFQNRTGKVAPEHKRLNRYPTMELQEIESLPVKSICDKYTYPGS